MGWQIAVVFDEGLNLDSLRILIGQMPVWASVIPERKEALNELNEEFRLFWVPEPAFTVFSPAVRSDPITSLIDLIPTIAEHHPRLSSVSVFGLEPTSQLRNRIAELEYEPIPDPNSIYPDRIRFAKPLSCIPSMPQILLNANGWTSPDDFYHAFFEAVGAPTWHGRNFNALDDSIGEGGINAVEVPYRITIRNADSIREDIAAFIHDFGELIKQLQSIGCPVDFVVEQS
jgi:RNAse (barnase) inhibitor barstar